MSKEKAKNRQHNSRDHGERQGPLRPLGLLLFTSLPTC